MYNPIYIYIFVAEIKSAQRDLMIQQPKTSELSTLSVKIVGEAKKRSTSWARVVRTNGMEDNKRLSQDGKRVKEQLPNIPQSKLLGKAGESFSQTQN